MMQLNMEPIPPVNQDGGLPLLSIVIPLHREASHLSASLDHIKKCAETTGLPLEFCLVDDGSPDATWEAVTAFAETHPRVQAIRFSRNFGKESALSAGLDLAHGDAVIIMDGDLQHPPDLIPEMVRLWREEGMEVVDGVKVDRGRESLAYKLCAKVFNNLMTRLSGFPMSGATDYKLLDRKVVDAWLAMGETRTFYRGMVAWLGFRHAHLPFRAAPRAGGSTSWSVMRLINLAVTALTSFSTLPLKLVTFLGVAFLIGAFILGTEALALWMKGAAVTGFTTVILLQLIIGGAVMVSLGIIGQYLAIIYDETKRRPRYIAAERLDPADNGGNP